ncbi:hypothetical protein BAE44_0013121, partial [Dichanthelium oligosanthes]
LLSTAYTLQ